MGLRIVGSWNKDMALAPDMPPAPDTASGSGHGAGFWTWRCSGMPLALDMVLYWITLGHDALLWCLQVI